MKLGIVGTGQVGCAIALAAVTRGSAREIVLVNRTRKMAETVATDIRYGTPLCDRVDVKDADYDGLDGAGLVLITSGVNEKTCGAIDRSDPQGAAQAPRPERCHLQGDRAEDRAGCTNGGGWSPSPIRRIRLPTSRAKPRVTIAYWHRHIPRQLAISRSSQPAFWRQSDGCRGAGDWRPWHLPTVLGPP